MGRFSPTVRTEAFDLGGVLDRLQAGYQSGRQMKEDRRRTARQEQLEDEDRNLYRRSLRAADLGRPGARTIGTQVTDPQSTPLTSASLRAMGDANVETVRPEFERPEPTKVKMLGGGTMMMQERAPYMTESGIIIDPSAARREQNLGTVLAAQTKRGITGPEPTGKERAKQVEIEARARLMGGRKTPEMLTEDVAHEGRMTAAGRTTTEGPPRSLNVIEQQIDNTLSEMRIASGASEMPREGDDAVIQTAYNEYLSRQNLRQERLDSLNTVRDRIVGDYQVEEGVVPRVLRGPSEIEPPTRLPVAAPIYAQPPRTTERPDLFTGIQRAVAGAGPPGAAAQAPGASPPAAPAPVTPTGPEDIPRAATPGESPSDDILIKLLERFGEDEAGMIAELKRLGYSTTD